MSNALRPATFMLLALIARAAATAAPADPHELAFWIGTWDLDDGTRTIGTSRVEWIAGGRAVRESYAQPGFTGQSLTAIDGTDGLWHQTWTDSLGRISRFGGAWRDGALRLEGASHGADGTIVRRRLMLAPRDDGTVRQWAERFDDARDDWVPLYDYVLRPRVETPPAPPEGAPEIPFRAEQACADAALLIRALRDIHPGYRRYRTDAEAGAAERELLAAAARGPDLGSFHLAVCRYLATVRCEHTEAEPPAALATWRSTHATMLPIDFTWVEDTAIVVGVAPLLAGVSVGDELLAVDGRSMRDLLTEMAPLISVDGFTDGTKPSIFAGSDDVGLTTFGQFHPLLHGWRDAFVLTLRDSEGVERLVRVPATDEAGSCAARGVAEAEANFSDDGAVSWRLVGDAAVLHVATFVNYRTPADPGAVLGAAFRAIADAGAARLVVDLRDVGGGSTDVMTSLLRHLVDRPITVGGPAHVRTYDFTPFRAFLSTWDESVFDLPESMFTLDGDAGLLVNPELAGGEHTLEPAADAWRGPLTVLIGPDNASGATILLAELRDERAVTFVGEPTGGSAEGPTADVLAFLRLPESQITVRVPLVRSTTSYRAFTPGKGIAPDVVVAPTIADVRAGRDRALEIAVRGAGSERR